MRIRSYDIQLTWKPKGVGAACIMHAHTGRVKGLVWRAGA